LFVVSNLDYLSFPHYYIFGLCLVCAVTDLRAGKIYNVITYPSIAVGILYSAVFGDRGGVVDSIVGFAIGFLPFALAASRGWIGAGDVKLFGAIGAIGGSFFLIACLFHTFVLAAAYGLLLVIWQAGRHYLFCYFPATPWLRAPSVVVLAHVALSRRRIRMGAFVFLGATLAIIRASALHGA
jgi:Flp pilus assembly protein protease CpaA